jgi:adenylosuccinate synthase
MAGKIQIVVGGQFGSEGKGHCAAELAAREDQMLAIRTGGPNAGHSAWGHPADQKVRRNPTEFKLRVVPVASVVNPRAQVALAARSLVQLDLAEQEVKETGVPMLLVDQAATVLEQAHILGEEGDEALAWGSTRKGIGLARMDRIHRTARTFTDAIGPELSNRVLECDVAELARQYLDRGQTVQIEAAQGYGLGLHTEFYPKTTSADCRAVDALADVGISPWEFPQCELEVWLVVRPNPIRVAGDSGPLREETTWEALGLTPERTTVTNKVRRVGGWDPSLVMDAVRANGSRNVKLWMNMADHRFPFLAGETSLAGFDRTQAHEVDDWIDHIEHQVGAPVEALGTGPRTAIFLREQW